MNIRVFYFGCIQKAGHYLWEKGQPASSSAARTGISDRFHSALDGTFCPPVKWGVGVYNRSHVYPFEIISWWDNSVDSRPGSHSTFLFSGCSPRDTDDELFVFAKHHFPQVFARQPMPTKGDETV